MKKIFIQLDQESKREKRSTKEIKAISIFTIQNLKIKMKNKAPALFVETPMESIWRVLRLSKLESLTNKSYQKAFNHLMSLKKKNLRKSMRKVTFWITD